MSNSRKYFGTDGIRGRVADEFLSPTFVQEIGKAVGTVFNGDTILVARDPRISGDMLQAALSAGICSTGVSVKDIGVLPTPVCAFLTKELNAVAGIVVSASHNPYYDNGIKLFNSTGNKLSDSQEISIEAILENKQAQAILTKHINSNNIGKISVDTSSVALYIQYCQKIINKLNSEKSLEHLKSLKVVVDCSNGAMYKLAPEVLSKLGVNLVVVNNEPNGFNINLDCGAACKKGLKKLANLVKDNAADLGIAFDGDGDRLMLVDAKGDIIDGDQILYILASEKMRTKQALPGMVGTLMSNLGLEQAMTSRGVDFLRAQVGDRYVLSKLIEKKWVLGGETSGHILNLDQITTGDGLITALLILSVMGNTQLSLYELTKEFHKYPQVLVNVDLGNYKSDNINCDKILAKNSIKSAISDIEHQLLGNGRIVVRKSGTEPLIRIMVEGDKLSEIEALANQLGHLIQVESS